MYKVLFNNRFVLFLATQVLILFGSLVVPAQFHENILLPILFLVNIIAGIILISERKYLMWFFILLFVISTIAFSSSMISRSEDGVLELIRLVIYFIFQIVVTYFIISQVWQASKVNRKVILGLISGYISLGFLAFLLFLTIEILQPGSFKGGLMELGSLDARGDTLMYYAYITMLTIGYGDIVPASAIAQKAAVLVGLIGQFYLVIITAVVVGKYIAHSMSKQK